MEKTLNARQDRGDIVCRAPSVLQDVKAELAVVVHVWVEHARQELDSWWFGRIALIEGEEELERAVFERCVHC